MTALLTIAPAAWAQQSPAKTDSDTSKDDVIQLSPFEVSSANDKGYSAAATLAGNHLNTELRDIGNAVTVINSQFLKDTGAKDNQTLLQYTTNTEVGNVLGNFSGNGDAALLDESPHFINPNTNTRVRGLTSADNTRDFFLTDIPWDAYNVDGVDLQRGPNSILFGQGSPAGIINSRLKQAAFKDSNEVQFRYGSNETNRVSLDINRVLIKDELAIRVAAVRDDEKYREDPAYSLSKRLFLSGRWEPQFLKKNGARTIIKADIEYGDINSNNPRTLPPIDLITPWFYTGTYQGLDVAGNPFTYNNLNKLTLIPSQNEDDNTNLPNHGQNRPAHNGVPIAGQPNQYFQPWVGNFGSQFGNPTVMYSGDSSVAQSPYIVWEPKSNHGIGPTGAVDLGVGGVPFERPAGVAPYSQYAVNAHLPFSALGLYKDKSLTDPTVFDFYNNLLDGPNKKEWQNFRVYNLELEQTFMDDHLGIQAIYNKEWYKDGQLSLLSGDKQAIGIDFNSVYSDGTPAGINGQSHADGTPNPNLGRAYVSDTSQYGNSSYVSNREDKRLLFFGNIDFTKGEHDNWFSHFMGKHVLTALLSDETQNVDNRNWQRYGTDASYEAFVNNLGADNDHKIRFTDNTLTPNSTIYLGPSLMSASSASGAFLPRITAVETTVSGNVRVFDSTWNKPTNPTDPGYVNPAAYWHNDYYPTLNPIDGTPFTAGDSTQSENPANYVGFRNLPINIIDSETSQANRDLLTHDARLTKNTVDSKAFTWQGHFWDNAIVATYGVRKDTAKSWATSLTSSAAYKDPAIDGAAAAANNTTDMYGHLDWSKYHLKDAYDNRLDITSHAWTVMVHLSQLPGLSKVMRNSPIDASLFYNHSTDFQPTAQRVDIYGDPLGPPKGVTKDAGILLETKDGKYSLKINRYETSSSNFSTPTLRDTWFIGSSQAWAANWVNRFQFNWTADDESGAVAVNDPTNSEYNYAQAPGETLAQAQTREANVIAAWRAWQQSLDPRFYAAWGINLNDHTKGVTAQTPNGLAITEDSVSKGYEIEFTANPTKNWRIAVNASRADAVRTNVGGPVLTQFMNAYANALQNTPVGDLRVWWGGAGNETTLQEWYSGNQPFGSEWAQVKLQEGTNVPELRRWHYNMITNYDWDTGFLKGVNVGGGVRYESSQVIGYAPSPDATLQNYSLQLDRPYRSPSETDFDVWVGYRRRIWRNIDWNIQLNIRNVGVGDKLIPLTTEPDGTPATYRIRPPQTWELTNTFTF